MVTTTTYTSASEIETQRTEQEGRLLSLREYAYDVRGNLTSRTDTTIDPGETGDARSVTTTEYEYDAHDRLVRSAERDGDADGTVTRETAYELSVSDDILSQTVTTDPGTAATKSVTRAFEYSPLGELVDIVTTRTGGDADATDGAGDRVEPEIEHRVQRYDAEGNRIVAFDGTVTEYDAANRPIVETTADGTVTRFAYWADGTRREQSTEHGTFGYYWDGRALVNDTYAAADGADGDGTAAYLLGSARHARSVTPAGAEPGGTDVEYLGTDRHQNVTDLTDAAGGLTTRYTYSDYGIQHRIDAPDAAPVTGLARNPFGYAGELTDESGRQYLQTRVYDGDTMRFTTADFEELHNLYAYADLNPVTKLDPTGRSALGDDWFADIVAPLVVIMLALATVIAVALAPPVAISAGMAVGYASQAIALVNVGIGFYVQAASDQAEDSDPEGTHFARNLIAGMSLATSIMGFGLSRAPSVLAGLYRDGTFGKLAASFRDSAKSLFSRPAPAPKAFDPRTKPINEIKTAINKTPQPSNTVVKSEVLGNTKELQSNGYYRLTETTRTTYNDGRVVISERTQQIPCLEAMAVRRMLWG